MKRQLKPPLVILLGVLLLVCMIPAGGHAANMCSVAADVARKGMDVFGQDQKNGIALLLQARSLCTHPVYDYNLGQAYYSYGDIQEALKYMEEAVRQDEKRPRWLNNLAYVLMETGQVARALTYAEKAVTLDKKYKPAINTLARARFMSGQRLEGLQTLNGASVQWPGDQEISDSRQNIVDEYIRYYLVQIRDGHVNEGLHGLEQAGFDPYVAEAHCRVLAKLGQVDKALAVSQEAMRRFSQTPRFAELNQEMLSKKIQTLYQEFKTGEPVLALTQAKAFSEQHPESEKAKKTYDDLFEAYTSDALGMVTVPNVEQARDTRPDNLESAEITDLLADIGSTGETGDSVFDLTVDVAEQIPVAAEKNTYGIAVIMANQNYEKTGRGISDVRYATRDGLIMKKYLESTLGYDPKNIIHMQDLTSGDFRNIFGSANNPVGMIHRYIREGESDLFIYYVGHGSPGQDGTSAYLVPVDAQVDFIENNGYPLSMMYAALQNLPALTVTLVMDACFSGDSAAGPLFRNVSPAMLKTVSPVREIAGVSIFAAADKDQVATWYPEKRHSLFTYYFLKGLQGSADINQDQQITLGEMKAFLDKEVPYMAGRISNRVQTPLITGETDSVIARLRLP